LTEAVLQDKCRILGAKIMYYRTIKGITQAPFAQELGISYQYLSRIECGKQTPSFHLLTEISEKLGVEVSSLVSNAR